MELSLCAANTSLKLTNQCWNLIQEINTVNTKKSIERSIWRKFFANLPKIERHCMRANSLREIKQYQVFIETMYRCMYKAKKNVFYSHTLYIFKAPSQKTSISHFLYQKYDWRGEIEIETHTWKLLGLNYEHAFQGLSKFMRKLIKMK